jgi:hypothetical protein
MRDPFLNIVLPFLADEMSKKGVEIDPCTCPTDGPCLGTEDGPEAMLVIQAMNDDFGFDPAAAGFVMPDYTDDFELTDEGAEELERQDNRDAVAHLGGIIDNMVYIVGMYTALVQNKVEG